MTRETKIGLLVGLGFIILFGLILGERTNSLPTQPPAEPPLLTHRYDSDPLGDGVARPGPLVAREPRGTPGMAPVRPEPVEEPVGAEGLGRQLVPPGGEIPLGGQPMQAGGVSAIPPVPPPTPAVGEVYTVKANDSLYKIAREKYGAENCREYKRILAANPDKLPNEKALLRPGMQLVIPPLEARPPVSEPRTVAPPATPPNPVAPPASAGGTRLAGTPRTGSPTTTAPAAPAPARDSYTVGQKDTLWTVAHRRLGGRVTVEQLREANKDLLAGRDTIRPGMVLRVP